MDYIMISSSQECNDYFIMANSVVDNENLSLKAKGLYAIIQSYIKRDGAMLSKEFLMSKSFDGQKGFDSAWKELKELGYLKQYKLREEGLNRFTYKYELSEEPDKEHINKVKSSEHKSGYIYVMKCLGYYKIGTSYNCSRLGEYTNLPEKPYYYIVEYVDNMAEVEKMLHKKYEYARKRSGECEWFDLEESDINDIKILIEPHIIKDVEHTKHYYKYINNTKQ